MQVSDLIEAFGTMIESDEEQQTSGLLPTHPLRLLHWLEDLDGALSRRLRNLSHGLNVELVRLGLCPILAPLRLLDAVISGQLEPQNAIPNLLQLDGLSEQLGDGMGIQTLAVMLRQADLEADQPRLRSCRNRLRQARQDVRRMTQTFHRLEQRLQALDAEQLWLHDHSMARMSPDQHPTRAAEPGQGQSMNRR